MDQTSLRPVAIDCTHAIFAGCKLVAGVESSLSNVRRALDGDVGVVHHSSCVAGRLTSGPSFVSTGGEYMSGSSRRARARYENTHPIRSDDEVSHVMSGCARCRSLSVTLHGSACSTGELRLEG